jgi:hypothetical protein
VISFAPLAKDDRCDRTLPRHWRTALHVRLPVRLGAAGAANPISSGSTSVASLGHVDACTQRPMPHKLPILAEEVRDFRQGHFAIG